MWTTECRIELPRIIILEVNKIFCAKIGNNFTKLFFLRNIIALACIQKFDEEKDHYNFILVVLRKLESWLIV